MDIQSYPDVMLGVVLGIMAAPIASLWLTPLVRKFLARRSHGQSVRRQDGLRRELDKIKRLHDDSGQLSHYLLSLILFVSIVWLTAEALANLLSFVANSTYSIGFVVNTLLPVDLITNEILDINAFLTAAILTITIRIAVRGYRTWLKVRDFDGYRKETEAELTLLKER